MNDEKTIYDNEKNQYQSQEESTVYEETVENQSKQAEEAVQEPEKSVPTWQRIAIGAVSGLVLGAAATFFATKASAEPTPEEPAINGNEGGNTTNTTQPWTDGEVQAASAVNDDMSFSQAFAAARAEVGPGGYFEWRGNVYSTYTAEEWDSMNAEQRDEYGSHFSWHSDANHDNPVQNEVASATVDQPDTVVAEVEVAEVTPAGNDDEAVVVDADPEVEILGVVHDEESGANIGGIMVDDQEVVLVDVDSDGTFDVMAADVDHDQQFTENEIVDIADQNLTVDDLGGIMNPTDPTLASNDIESDYVNDAPFYDA